MDPTDRPIWIRKGQRAGSSGYPLFFRGSDFMGSELSLVIIITEGIRGHLNQSRGVARWLSEYTGARVEELQVPSLSGFRKFIQLRLKARFLGKYRAEKCQYWLENAHAGDLMASVSDLVEDVPGKEKGCLLLSAGNTPAPFSLALGRMFGIRKAVIMTPSIADISSYDFAIIPEHDFPQSRENLIVTLGAPNAVIKLDLEKQGRELIRTYPPLNSRSWGILIGGDSANYSIDPDWIKLNIGTLLKIATERNTDLYITTSRRTRPDAERTLEEITRGYQNVRMNLLASRDPGNPVPGMLGQCDRIFCTEDSVSMLSEAATSGKQVFLLRVRKKGGLKMFLGKLTQDLVQANILPLSSLWGFYRFEYMRQRLIDKGLLIELPSHESKWADLIDRPVREGKDEFNEAKRSAEWISGEWQK